MLSTRFSLGASVYSPMPLVTGLSAEGDAYPMATTSTFSGCLRWFSSVAGSALFTMARRGVTASPHLIANARGLADSAPGEAAGVDVSASLETPVPSSTGPSATSDAAQPAAHVV